MKKVVLIILFLQAMAYGYDVQYGSDAYGVGNYSICSTKVLDEFSQSWLTDDYYWDFNSDGIVNFVDYAYWMRWL